MKILYLGTTDCPNAEYITYALKHEDIEVKLWEESEHTAKQVLNHKHDLLLVEEGRLKGDHRSFQMFEKSSRNVILGYFQEVIDKSKVPIVSWITNIFFGVMQREPEIKTNPIFKASVVFSTDGGHQKEFEEAGVNHFLLRQGIHEPEAYISGPTYDTKAEIGFIGAVYDDIWPYRLKLVNSLKETYGEKFEHFGQHGDIRHGELNNLIATLKIVIGDSVQSPQYWSNRLYEMLGRGAFLIFPLTDGIDREFTPYKHFIPYEFGDLKGLNEIIDYYLPREKERKEIAQAGLEHCKKNHTYQIRVKEMLRVLKEQKVI